MAGVRAGPSTHSDSRMAILAIAAPGFLSASINGILSSVGAAL